jgi:hypothetical protein
VVILIERHVDNDRNAAFICRDTGPPCPGGRI